VPAPLVPSPESPVADIVLVLGAWPTLTWAAVRLTVTANTVANVVQTLSDIASLYLLRLPGGPSDEKRQCFEGSPNLSFHRGMPELLNANPEHDRRRAFACLPLINDRFVGRTDSTRELRLR
jgi:hypothetical protein